jgi:hypothetical protein
MALPLSFRKLDSYPSLPPYSFQRNLQKHNFVEKKELRPGSTDLKQNRNSKIGLAQGRCFVKQKPEAVFCIVKNNRVGL